MRFVFLMLLASVVFANETTYDVMWANWYPKEWEVELYKANSKNGVLSASQDVKSGFMHRIFYNTGNRLGMRPFASLATSEESKSVIGALGLGYSFENLEVIFETEAGKFGVETTMDEDTYDGECNYMGLKLKVAADIRGNKLGGFIAYKQVESPNVDILIDGSDGEIIDLYYDKDYSSSVASLGLYAVFISKDESLLLEFNIGFGVAIGYPGSDVTNDVQNQWQVEAKDYANIGIDYTIDLRYRDRISNYGIWFVGIRASGFGHLDAISGAIEQGDDESLKNDGKFNPEFRASRVDLVYGPYVGLGLVF